MLLKLLFLFIFPVKAEIAEPTKALTFCRTKFGGDIKMWLVTSEEEESIRGKDISELVGSRNFLDLFGRHSYGEIVRLSENIKEKTFSRSHLIVPVNGGVRHLAAGGNFPEHAEEASLEKVFLFPKFSLTTGPVSQVRTSQSMLMDYEVEICTIFDRDIKTTSDYQKSVKALFLCGDYSDRAKLLRRINTENVESGRGFTDAKSGNDRFPVGEYLVLPKNFESFSKNIDFSLSVNGELRQDSNTNKMILDFRSLVIKSLQDNDKKDLELNGKKIPLLEEETLKRGQALLSGTAEGVVFQRLSLVYKIKKGTKWFFTLSFLRKDPVSYVLEEYIKESFKKKIYLQNNDEVLMRARYLGKSRQKIVESELK